MTIYELLGFQDKSILNIDISPEKILKNAREKKSKKDLSAEKHFIQKITLKYSYKANGSYIASYMEALELQVIEISVDKTWIIPVVAQVLQECIPYPVLIVFVHHGRYMIANSLVRRNCIDGELIADDFTYSRWIYDEELNPEISEYNFESVNTNIFEDAESINEILQNLYDVCYELGSPRNERLFCLREVMDIFKLIEYEKGKLELEAFLKRQMLHGNYELLDDTVALINFPNELDHFKDEYYYGSLGEFDGKRFFLNKESDIEYTTFDELRDMEDYALQWERDDNFEYDPVMRMIGGED